MGSTDDPLPARNGAVIDRDLAARLRQIRLDLLPILHELLHTASVTRTARALGMTQPAVSQALRRLRALFDDDLLIARGRGLQLTDRAQALKQPVHRALAELDQLLLPPRPFDPAREELRVAIATADYASLLLAPLLAAICAAEAPNVAFDFVETHIRTAEDLARVDFMVTPRAFRETLGKRIGSMSLWHDDVVCIAATGNRKVPDPISVPTFQQYRHVGYQMNPRVPAGVRALLQPTSALETRKVCAVPDFLVLGAIVAKADCLALVPRRLARDLMRWQAVRMIELTFDDRDFEMEASWSLAATGRRGHDWARDLLGRAALLLD